MSENEVILQNINSLSAQLAALQVRIDERFDHVDIRFDKLNGRVSRTELVLARMKAVGGAAIALMAFFGWDHIKLWLVALRP